MARDISMARREPQVPTVFMPGFPKSATTWLYDCALGTFSPDRVCRSHDPSDWIRSRCATRFLLPTLSTNAFGDVRHQKEAFAFGGASSAPLVRDDNELTGLHGPDPRGAAMTAELSPLWLWESNLHRMQRWQQANAAPGDGGDNAKQHLTAAAAATRRTMQTEQTARVMQICEAARDSGKQAHRSCLLVSKETRDPSPWACKWDDRLNTALNRSYAYCLRSITPWLAAGEANATVIDFTPNYVCDPDAYPPVDSNSPTLPQPCPFTQPCVCIRAGSDEYA